MKEYKSVCEFNDIGLSTDKVKQHKQIHQIVAAKYAIKIYFGLKEKISQKKIKEMPQEDVNKAILLSTVGQTGHAYYSII